MSFRTLRLRLHGQIASARDPVATDEAEDAQAEAETLAMRPLQAHCHLALGQLYRRTGDRAKAAEHLSTAATMYGEMDMGFWLAEAEEVLKNFG